LYRTRLVVGRSAAHDRGDVRVAQLEAVAASDRRGLVGVARPVESAVEPVARAVAREHAAGAVSAVGGGCQTNDEEGGAGIAEPGHGPSPVLLVPERRPLLGRHLFTPG